MPRYRNYSQPETLIEFLDSYVVATLKNLAGLLTSDLPTRKAEIIAIIQKRLEDAASLQRLWEGLDPLGQKAVAEVVHSSSSSFEAASFRAKYGSDPDWGEKSSYGEFKKPSLLNLFI